jgi:hypothetical protein
MVKSVAMLKEKGWLAHVCEAQWSMFEDEFKQSCELGTDGFGVGNLVL